MPGPVSQNYEGPPSPPQQTVVTCAWCGYEFPPNTPTANHKILYDHALVCEKHPTHAVAVERDKAINLLKAVRAKLMAAPELNTSNYTADEVAKLDATVSEAVCAMDDSGLNLS